MRKLAVAAVAAAAVARIGQAVAVGMQLSVFYALSLMTLIVPLAVLPVLAWGLWKRLKLVRVTAIVLGALRAVAIVASFFGFAFGGTAMGLAFGALELVALAGGAFALLRPGAGKIWSR